MHSAIGLLSFEPETACTPTLWQVLLLFLQSYLVNQIEHIAILFASAITRQPLASLLDQLCRPSDSVTPN